ncbi:MAG: tetratricopeptide repeat protein [Myxococcota bacterium]
MKNPTIRLTGLSLALLVGLATPHALAAEADEKAEGEGAPGFAIETKAKERDRSRLNEQTILANIENQKMILELEDPSSEDFPEMVAALADFYWDLAEVYTRRGHRDSLEQAIYDAEEAGNSGKLRELRAEQERLDAKADRFREKTIQSYRDVVKRFPDSPKIDELRYYLGYHLAEMGRGEEAVEAYTQLILKHPESSYVPDALVNIGEYYFELNEYADALKLYEKVEEYPEAPVLAYAIYKQAWCHYNLGSYDLSLSKMLAVLKKTRAQHEAGVVGAIDLMAEARKELIYPYSKVGKASAAIAFFKKYAPGVYLDLSSRLASLYTEQTEFAKSNRLLRSLIREAKKTEDKQYMVLRFQRQIVDNSHRQANKAATVEEVRELIRQFEEVKETAPDDFLAKEEERIDRQILEIATGYHSEYKTTKEQESLEYTQMLYDEYLRLFRDKPNAYDISYNNALLMLATGKYAPAAEEFERVIAMKPEGKHADDAGERAVVAYLETLREGQGIDNEDVKDEARADLSRRELTPEEQRFVVAVDRWMEIIERKGTSPETRDNIPPARFAAAKILYSANHFQEAAKRFVTFYEEHPDHEFWYDAARHVLSAYNLDHDVDNLLKYANRFAADPALAETELAADVKRIKSEISFQRCFKFEQREEHLGAAKCFVQYGEDNPQAEKVPAALFNAGLNYFRAKQVEKALTMQKRLFEEHSDHKLAAKALYSIGEIFRETTVYDQAAQVYEAFVSSYPDHPLAEKALRYASIFRKTLGEYDKAVQNLETWLDRYADEETAPRVHLDIVLIREKQGNEWKTISTVGDHLKAYPDEPAAIRLKVLAARARAFDGLRKRKRAHKYFQQTVDYFAELEDEQIEGLDLEAISAVAEAHFNLGEHVLARAKWIKLKAGEKQMQKAIKRKLELLNEAKTLYEQVIAYGHPGWTIAAYAQLGSAYRDLADAVENAPIPRRIRHLDEAVYEYKTIMAEKATPIRDKALASYKTALDTAREAHWFNEYSEQAEEAIAQLDLTDRSIKEARLRPDRTGPNAGLPDFKREVR